MAGRVIPERRLRVRQFILRRHCNFEVRDSIFVIALSHRYLSLHQLVCDLQQQRSRVLDGVKEFHAAGFLQPLELRMLGTRRIEIVLAGVSRRAYVMPDGIRVIQVGGRLRLCQNVIPLAELSQRQQRNGLEEFDPGKFFHHFQPHIVGDLPGRIDGNGAASFHARGRPQEMNVMRVVGSGIEALGVTGGDVGLVNRGCQDIGPGCVVVASNPPVNVRRHVHQVSGTGHQILQGVGRRFCALRR